ncbi:hypothetical protein F0562_007673 [Nyssa sinensis]|uniref:Uncharacterized protein n=1 Tax=Nyssa sinensis TaxID=561372 RepID=A0A5J5A722_9ASTE|nr:hypothetical protein F0562_007673 [Nyssa sinensis]
MRGKHYPLIQRLLALLLLLELWLWLMELKYQLSLSQLNTRLSLIDNDQPIQCPLPEPSILNDARIWKKRVSAGVQRRADLPVMQEGNPIKSEAARTKPQPRSSRLILPSISAPEHNILELLEECNASGI